MLRKVLRLSLVLACVLLLSAPAYANVVGTWDIDAIVNQKVTVKKIGSYSAKGAATDQFVFGQDASFELLDLPDGSATWAYKSKKAFAVYVDETALRTYWMTQLETMLAAKGISAEVQSLTITKNVFTGTENTKTDTIKGKWNLAFQASIYVAIASKKLNVNVNATTTFNGVRDASGNAVSSKSAKAEELSGETIGSIIMEEVCSQIDDAMTAADSAE